MSLLHAKDFDFRNWERVEPTEKPAPRIRKPVEPEVKRKPQFDCIEHGVKTRWNFGLDVEEIARQLGIRRCEVHRILGLDFDED